MTNFKPLELEDIEIFRQYLGEYPFNTYEYSFPALFLWRKMSKTEISLVNGALVVKKTGRNGDSCFMPPIGCKKSELGRTVEQLNDYKLDKGFSTLFMDVEEPFLHELIGIFGDKITFREDANNFDYVYDSRQLIALQGKKFHKKKNQYNQFVNSYRYDVVDLTEGNAIADSLEFSKNWYLCRSKPDEQLKYEMESMEDFLLNAGTLGVKGIAVYIGGCVAGFTAGEKVNEKMGIVHIEKGDLSFHGIYAFLNKTFAERHFNGVQLINRQEDLGVEGLRKAKMAYHPISLVKKFVVDLETGGAI